MDNKETTLTPAQLALLDEVIAGLQDCRNACAEGTRSFEFAFNDLFEDAANLSSLLDIMRRRMTRSARRIDNASVGRTWVDVSSTDDG